ncbi:hypothetical protein B0H13DRAFT_2054947 [Mycena leptocephala]|nr:hypothetical protein B0H13DRAFT_2054947 [Mycena leptocephala]
MASPIIQASPPNTTPAAAPDVLTHLILDLRGWEFTIDMEAIMSLPQSITHCLFPRGLSQSELRTHGDLLDDDDLMGQVIYYECDFDPGCFQYVLQFFEAASVAFYAAPEPTSPGFLRQSCGFSAADHVSDNQAVHNPLLSKQAIIVLREELQYFMIPLKNECPTAPTNYEDLLELKQEGGQYLLKKRNIFQALHSFPDQHFINTLYVSGFKPDDEWGFRALEPTCSRLSSIALVLLKTGIADNIEVDHIQAAIAKNFLAFWRNPARRCWWDQIDVDLPLKTFRQSGNAVKLWSRRVWTLELCLI